MANSALNKLKAKVKSKTLVGKQKNLDVNKNGKLDKEDFKILRGNKMAKGGATKVAKFKVEDMVYSYQNKDYAAPINYVKFNPWDSNSGTHPNDTYKYRLSLKDGHSNWIDEKSLYKTKQKEYAKGGETSKDLDKKLAKIVLNNLIKEKYEFSEIYSLSRFIRENIKNEYKERLPITLANPDNYKMSSTILRPLINKDVYMDDDALIVGNKKVMSVNKNTTWKDVADELNIDYEKVSEKKEQYKVVHSFKDKMADGGETGKYNREKLLKEVEEYDDILITNKDGEEFIVYSPSDYNDENTALWKSNDYIIGTIPNDGREVKVKYSDIVKVSHEQHDDYAKGGELSEDKMIQKLSKQFEGKDLWDDEIMDEYEVKMFDYREDEEMEKWKRKNREKNYIVPFDSEDDSYVFILVPKDKMEKGGYMADGGSIPNNYKGKKPEQVWNEWTAEQKRHFVEDHEDQLRKTGGDTLTLLKLSKKSYDDLPLYVSNALIEHVTTGQYAEGGETKKEKSYIIVGRNITIKSDDVKDFIKRANVNGYTLNKVYKKNDEEVKSANPIYDFSWMIGLPKFKELVGPMKDGPNQFRYEDEWVNERMSVEKGGYMADGGETYDKALFKKELVEFKKEIKEGYGWISPDYVSDSWENMGLKTNVSKFKSQASQDLFKDLIDSGLLYHEEYEGNEEQGEKIESFRELYGFNYGEKYEKGGYMANGGTLEEQNNDMLQSTITEMKHHVDELKSVVSKNTEVEPWVIAKAERASTDLSDITHYLEGEKQKGLEMPFEKGGYMTEGGMMSGNSVVKEKIDSVLSSNTNEELNRFINPVKFMLEQAFAEDVDIEMIEYEATKEMGFQLEMSEMSNNKNNYKELRLIFAKIKAIFNNASAGFMAKGGYMAEGGEVNSKIKELQTNLSKAITKSQDEIKALGQYYNVGSTSLKSLAEAFAKLNSAAIDILFGTYDKDLKSKEGMEKGGYMAAGGMTPGRYYKDNSGNELRYVGESKGKLLFKDGEKIVEKEESDFEDSPKEDSFFGFFKEGGEIKNQYENLTPKEIWSMWTEKQRMHFIRDHKHEFPEIMDSTFILAKKDFGKLPARVQIAVEFHTEDGEYAMGGRLSFQSHQRMDELTSITTKKEFKKAANSLRYELTEDGFENDEVDKFLCHLVSNSYAKGGYMAKGGEIDSEKYEAVQTINQLKSAIATNPNIETDTKVFIDGRLSNIMRLVDKAYAGLEEHEDVKKLYFYIDSATENIDEIQKELVSNKSQTSIESDYIAKKLEDLYDLVSNMGFNIEMEKED